MRLGVCEWKKLVIQESREREKCFLLFNRFFGERIVKERNEIDEVTTWFIRINVTSSSGS